MAMLLPEDRRYGLICNKFTRAIQSIIAGTEDPPFIGGQGITVSLESFKTEFINSFKKTVSNLNWILFDVSYLRSEDDLFPAIDFMKRNIPGDALTKILIIAPSLYNKEVIRKIFGTGEYNIITFYGTEFYEADIKEQESEIKHEIYDIVTNPRQYSQAMDALSAMPDVPTEDTSDSKSGIFGGIMGGKKNKPTKKEEKKVETKHVAILSNEQWFIKKMKEECNDSEGKYEIIDIDDFDVPSMADFFVIEGNIDAEDINDYNFDTDIIKTIIVNNNYINANEYEGIASANVSKSDDLIAVLFEGKKSKAKPEKKPAAKKVNPQKKVKEHNSSNIFLKIFIAIVVIALLAGVGLFAYAKFFANKQGGVTDNPPAAERIDPESIYSLTSDEIEISYNDGFDPGEYVGNVKTGYNVVNTEITDDSIPGDYTVTYKAIKKSTKKPIEGSEKNLTVHIIDDVKPVITLTSDKITLDVASNASFNCMTYVDSAIDEIDGDLKDNITCSEFDDGKCNQQIYYRVSDNAGNIGESVLDVTVTNCGIDVNPTQEPPVSEDGEDQPASGTLCGADCFEVTVDNVTLKVESSENDIKNAVQNAVHVKTAKSGAQGQVTFSIDYSKVNTITPGNYDVSYMMTYPDGSSNVVVSQLTVVK